MFIDDLFMNLCNKTHLNRVLDTLGAKLSKVDRHHRGLWIVVNVTSALSWMIWRPGLRVNALSDGA